MQRRIPIAAFSDKSAAGTFDEALFRLQALAGGIVAKSGMRKCTAAIRANA
jgi:hypothetical protein